MSVTSTAAPVPTARDNILRVGDYVSLKFPKHQAYLSAEGILIDDLYVSTNVSFFEENLFQIYVQRQYSATNELEEFLEANGGDPNLLDPATASYMEALNRGKENEGILNKSVMKSKTGNIVCFGDTIQLLHVKSNKFVTVKPADLARDERENMKVTLSYDGSIMSWLKVMPRFKINREGEPVTNGTEILLRVSERSNEYLHCADRPPPRGKFREVNSSLEVPTGWKVSIFQRADDIINPNLLLSGQLMTIKDPEFQCMLAPLPRPINLERPVSASRHATTPHSEIPTREISPQLSGVKHTPSGESSHPSDPAIVTEVVPEEGEDTLADTDEEDDLISLTSTEEFIRDHGTVGMKPMTEEIIDSDCIWMMESKQIIKGGLVKFQTDRVHFRHVNSGKYLAIRLREDTNDDYVLTLEKDPDERFTLFYIQEVHSTGEELHNGRAVQIKHAHLNLYLQRGMYSDSQKIFSCLTTRSKGKALSMIATRYIQAKGNHGALANPTANISSGAHGHETLDLYVVKSVMYHLQKYVRATETPLLFTNEITNATFWNKLDVFDRNFFTTLMIRTTLFVRGFPIAFKAGSTDELTKYRAGKAIITRRQNMLREVGVLESMMMMIKYLQPLSRLITTDASTNRLLKSGYIEMGKSVLAECLGLIHTLIKENLSNQLYISDHLLTILSHISTDKMAAHIAQELLNSNRELQETKIGTKEITIFTERMREVHMNAMYLDLLKTCCSCLGQGLPRNQEIVQHVLFQQYKDVLIKVIIDRNMSLQLVWNKDSPAFQLFYQNRGDACPVRCEELYTIGVPSIRLTWTVRSQRFAIQNLFNRDNVLLSEVLERDRGMLMRGMSSKKLSVQKDQQGDALKKKVADFFISQIFLVGEMCLDRNYPIIFEMEKLYPYDFLVTVLKSSGNELFKSAVAYLIHHLYVNRDPYSETSVPRFTRTLTEISRSENQFFVCLSKDHCYQFAFLQILISEHLEEIRGRPFAMDSLQLLQLLHSLVKYNFYGQYEKIVHLIQLLTQCLLRGDYDCMSGELDSEIGLKKMNAVAAMNRAQSRKTLTAKKNTARISVATPATTPKGAGNGGFNEAGSGTGSSLALNGYNNNSARSSSDGGTNSFHQSGSSEKDDSSMNLSEKNEDSLLSDSHRTDPRNRTRKTGLAADLLAKIESPWAHALMVFFAVAAVAVTIYELVANIHNEWGFRLFEAIVLAVFVWELLFHLIFYGLVHHNLHTFFYHWHNILDVITVGLYLLVFVAEGYTIYVKFLRLSRLIVLYKVYYALQEAAQNLLENQEMITTWQPPNRYHKTSDYSMKSLVEIVKILNNIQHNLEDRALSILLQKFLVWQQDSKATIEACPEIFYSVTKAMEEVTISDTNKDEIFMDLIMYANSDLVQTTLDLLMAHHSSQQILLTNMNKLQMITSEADEQQYAKLEKMIHTLKRHGETHEIWGRLTTPEHQQINEEVHQYLTELVTHCRKRREVLKFDESYEPIKFIQNILRNLGSFEVCMKIAQLILTIEGSQSSSSSASTNNNNTNTPYQSGRESDLAYYKNTRELALAANTLLYWFTIDNPINQQLVYTELKFFMKTIDAKINSHYVIKAIFRDNIDLMELVPKKYIGDNIELICTTGKFPQYLALMSSIINVGEKNMIRNQYEVIKLMSSPDNMKKILLYFVPTVNSHEYQKKIRLMSHYLTAKDVRIDDLPSDLAYHLELMQLLSCCTIGTSGMTSIEAKVQSMFHFVDIIEGMLDANCLLLAKIRMGLFLYNAFLDVETPVPAIKDAACIWKLLIAAQDVIAFAKDDLRQIEKNGWESPSSNRQKIEYMLVNVMIIESYFKDYYDPMIYKLDYGQVAYGVERVQIKEYQGQEIINSLFMKIQAIYEMMSPLLPSESHVLLYNTLVILNNKSKEPIVGEVTNIHESFLKAAEEYQAADEEYLNKSYEKFIEIISSLSSVKETAEKQIQGFLQKIEQLPSQFDQERTNDVRFEPFIEKLVSHIRSCVQVVIHGEDSIKFMNSNMTKTSIWILKMLRTMIENRWGMTIYERDDDGGEEQDDAVIELMKVFNQSGVTEMCLDLIAKGIDITLQAEALKLLVGMLFKEGGAIDIQRSIHHHLSQPGSDLFFRTVRQILQNLISWHKWNGIIHLEEGNDPELPDEIIIVRCLQLMCEGHYLPNQDLFREQPNNYTSINLLDDFVAYLQCLDPIKCRTSTAAELTVSAVVLEVIQGPCEGNQNYFALNTELIETLNRKIRQHPINDCDEEEELELKKSCIDILQALLEGQGRKTAIYERMLSVIHIDVILVLCKGSSVANTGNADGKENTNAKDEEEESDAVIELKTESLVLLNMLTDFRPQLRVEYGLDEDFNKQSSESVACIEVVWHGELQRRFFHVPDICHALAKSSKDLFILNVKRDSPEDKLYGLLEAAKEMYREVCHQKYLKEMNLDWFFSRTNQDRVHWANFYLACAINLLFVLFYTTERVTCGDKGLYQSQLIYYYTPPDDDGGASGSAVLLPSIYEMSSILPYVIPQEEISTEALTPADFPFCTAALIRESSVRLTIVILNVVLIVGAIYSLLSNVVVRAPVDYQRILENVNTTTLGIIYTASQFHLLYSGLYLIITILGLLYHPCLSFLLLDFIKLSPSTQAVLNAVYEPRRAITMTVVLICIFMYIYAFFQWNYFVGPEVDEENSNYVFQATLITLGNFTKFLIRYGFPFASPQDYANVSIDMDRLLTDVSFYLTCLIMLNILKGITIDTFVSLRKKLEARIEDTTEKCFICGIEKNTFNRTLDRNAFKVHTKEDQNLWNYIYFIMFIWEQDKDDDDGLETYVRKCVRNNDLTWFPLNKALKLTQHQEKGDVTSLKYRFRQEMLSTEETLGLRMNDVKDQIARTMGRVEKALEYEQDGDKRGRTGKSRATAQGLPPLPIGGRRPTGTAASSLTTDRSGLASGGKSVGMTPPISARVRSPFLNPIPAVKKTTALDADILGQMHLRLIAITNLKIPPSLIKYISVRIMSRYEVSILQPLFNLKEVQSISKPGTPTHSLTPSASVNPLTTSFSLSSSQNPLSTTSAGAAVTPSNVRYRTKSVEKVSASIKNSRASFISNRPKTPGERSITPELPLPFQQLLNNDGPYGNATLVYREKDQIQLRFDLINNPPTLVHQGLIPASDLSKYYVKIQVVFNVHQFYLDMFRQAPTKMESEAMIADHIYLGGATIPITTMLSLAHEGKLLDVPFIQNCVEIPFPSFDQLPPERVAEFVADGINVSDNHSNTNDFEDTLNLPSARSVKTSLTRSSSGSSVRYHKRKSASRGLFLIIPASDECSITISSVASHRLLEDWALIRKRL